MRSWVRTGSGNCGYRLINLFAESAAGLRTVEDPDTALAAMATGTQHGQFWTDGDTDIFVSWKDGRLVWVLDACFCYRRAVPEAAAFRELHGRLTGLWLDVAQRLDADVGRVDDPAAVDPLAYEDIHRRWLR